MPNFLITLRFDGSAYHGFQVQENAVSVCEVFQDAVEKILKIRYDVKGCSRTDAGVHARMFCLSMKADTAIPPESLLRALNTALPEDIAVVDICIVPDDFHARYSCVSKTYRYLICNAAAKDPFRPTRVLHYPRPLDADFLDKQARGFTGEHDFSAFCATGASVRDTVRNVYSAAVWRDGDDVVFEVRADGFLYNMVRIMVGTLLEIAEGRIAADTIPDIIKSRDRNRAGKTAPARGLYLYHVEYGVAHESNGSKKGS
jgi:tRNA pseudouridine38-40 synthase